MKFKNKLAIATSIAGLVAIVFTLINNVSSCNKDKAETTKLEHDINSTEPRISISYADAAIDLHEDRTSQNHEETSIEKLAKVPISDNGLLADHEKILIDPKAKQQSKHFVYLLLENRGQDAAINISLEFIRCDLERPVTIKHSTSGELNYEDIIISAANSQSNYTHRVPIEIGVGEKLLIPLLVAGVVIGKEDLSKEWNIISKIVYLPKTIKYRSENSKKEYDVPVRKMEAPVKISDLLDIRG